MATNQPTNQKSIGRHFYLPIFGLSVEFDLLEFFNSADRATRLGHHEMHVLAVMKIHFTDPETS